jgi:SAM-dependent methyltransferase
MDNKQVSEIKLRNEQAECYDDIFFNTRGKYWINAQIKLVLHFLNLQKNQYILDAGCGTGIYSNEILKLKNNIYIDAIDFSDSEIQIFKNKLDSDDKEKVKMYVSDLLSFEYPELKYDRISLIEVLQHIPTFEKRLEIMKKLFNATKKNGCLVSLNYLWGGFIKPPHIKEDYNYNDKGLYRFAFTNDELESLFYESGFGKVKNIDILRAPYILRKFVPSKLSYFIERIFILSKVFGKRSKYVMTLGYKL